VDTKLVDLLDSGGAEQALGEEFNEEARQVNGDVAADTGFSVLDGYRRTPTHTLFKAIVEKVIRNLEEFARGASNPVDNHLYLHEDSPYFESYQSPCLGQVVGIVLHTCLSLLSGNLSFSFLILHSLGRNGLVR